MDFIDALEYLYRQRPYGKIKLGLYRIEELVEKLGHPEKKFKSVHITGSNGKGSVTTFVHYLMKEHGYKVGGYISPHLSTIFERFPLNGGYISKDRFLESFLKVKTSCEEMDKKGEEYAPSFFEFTTALSFQICADEDVDAASIEVGLGGRYDATNVIIPKVSVIVTVSLEHTKILGNTIAKIAFEKAGIIKEKVPVVLGNLPPVARDIVHHEAQKRQAPIFEYKKDFDFEVKDYKFNMNTFDYFGDTTIKNIPVKMNGTHQPINASIALKVFEIFHGKLDKDAVTRAFKNAFLPGRFEMYKGFLFDGSHNPQAAEKFVENLSLYFPDKTKTAIIGILDDKDKNSVLSTLCPAFDKIIITKPPSHRAVNSYETYEIARQLHDKVSYIEDPINAFERLKTMEGDLKIIVGSFYLVGYIRSYLEKGFVDKEWDVMRR
ncbi:bifunctional folylpolyglutamate synthase/dihydrofolate synthase [Thermosipho ferrireducens]|uniref:tetrahydrofolate synthase n=1 Tax=Thermosipho ferrireducens TaxID=2571116 RepID=A0ABX7S881_9BACT|nr:folylpolyglutamate synthase/dihydrofolate synthase family protein [Thermosipho ferrireducens]QTA38005.1 bifunctional folylpolyglutamate synthase/dihydrofolate synthase [Thermosipho ferrireducens]